MSMNDVGAPFARDDPELPRAANVPFASQCQPVGWKSRALGALHQRRACRCDDEGPIAAVVKASREEQYLALPPPPATSGIDVQNSRE